MFGCFVEVKYLGVECRGDVVNYVVEFLFFVFVVGDFCVEFEFLWICKIVYFLVDNFEVFVYIDFFDV